MKKAIISLVTVFSLLLCSVVFCAGKALGQKNSISFDLLAESGDRAYAENLIYETGFCTVDRTLVWNVKNEINKETKSEFSFHKVGLPYEDMTVHEGLSMESANFTMLLSELSREKSYPEHEFFTKLKEIEDSMKNGEIDSYTIKLADYFEYYPLDILIDTEKNYNYIKYFFSKKDGEQEISRIINEYFKIPVEDNHMLHIYSDDIYPYINFQGGHTPYIGTDSSFIMNDKVYFIFVNRTFNEDGSSNIIDYSGVKEGYGIYSCEITDGVPDVKTLHNVYPMDNSLGSAYIEKDGDKILLYYLDSGIYKLTVINENTMTDENTFNIYEKDKYINKVSVKTDEGIFFSVLFEDGRLLYLLQKDEQGFYRETFSVKVPYLSDEKVKAEINRSYDGSLEDFGDLSENRLMSEYSSFAFDGERLAVITPAGMGGMSLLFPGYMLSVYTSEGLMYSAVYSCSTGDGIAPDNYTQCIYPLQESKRPGRLYFNK